MNNTSEISKNSFIKKCFLFADKFNWNLAVRWIIFISAVAAITILFRQGDSLYYSDLKLNMISPREIIAPFDFEVLKSENEINSEKDAVSSEISPVFRLNPNKELENLESLLLFFAEIDNHTMGNISKTTADTIVNKLSLKLSNKYAHALLHEIIKLASDPASANKWNLLKETIRNSLQTAFNSGILDREIITLNSRSSDITVISHGIEKNYPLQTFPDITQAKQDIFNDIVKSKQLSEPEIRLAYDIALNFLEPNLIYDFNTTEYRIKEASSKIALAQGIIFKGERIIDSNERITQQHLDILRSLAQKKSETSASAKGIGKIIPLSGKIAFSAGLLFIFGFLIFNYRPEIASNKNFILLLLLLIVPLFFLQIILTPTNISRILFPSALAAMLVSIFFGYRIGFWFLMILALFAGAMQGGDYFIVLLTLVIGSAGIVSVKAIRSRSQLLTSAFYLAAAHLIIITLYNLINNPTGEGYINQLGIAAITSGMTPIFVLGFAIILGNIFDITTDLTLIELSDLNRPLLKMLAATTPGTYHHSLMVGTLAEAAAEAVGANPLLARTAAYYHDIGKIEKRDYFIENQIVFNPHDTITPEESARILNSHVISGLTLAEKHRLPRVIKDAITEHHGTSVMQYFYVKAMNKSKTEVDKEPFKYPGPLPVSRENGIIMLADSVEAAVRAMGQASADEVRERVKKIIEAKFYDGQLDKCELSLRDLQIVEDCFVNTLVAQSHQRIAYPSRTEIESLKNEKSV